MLCINCAKFLLNPAKRKCLRCQGIITNNISCICDKCSAQERVCSVCLKKVLNGSSGVSTKKFGCNCGGRK